MGEKMKKMLCIMTIFVLGLIVLSGCGQPTKTPTGNAICVGGACGIGSDSQDSNLIAKLSDIPPGSIKEFTYNGESAILVNFDGDVRAYINKCTHQGSEFTESSLINDKIQCPLHGATFKPSSGEYDGHANGNNFGLAGLTMIDVKIESGNIYAE